MHKFGCYKPGGRSMSPSAARELKAKNPDAVCEVKSKSDSDKILYYRRPGIADKIELGEKKEKAEKQEKTLLGKAKSGPALDRVRARISEYAGKLQSNEKAYKMAMMLLYPSVPDIKRDIVQKQMVEIERKPSESGLAAVLQETGIAPDLLTEMKQESPAQPQPAIADQPQEPPAPQEQEEQEEKSEPPKKLFPFQETGVSFLKTHARALFADQMGLGKTVQVASALAESDAPTIIVCPASLKLNWERELKKWAPGLKTSVLSGKDSFRAPEKGEAVIVNYDILPAELKEKPPAGLRLVADEAQYVKNYKTQRAQRLRAIAEKSEKVWALTGTPLPNRPPDLWGVLESCNMAEHTFGNFGKFYRLFNASKGKYGTNWGMPRAEVPQILSRVMLRRLRKDVLPELPEKTYKDIEVNSISNKLLKKLDDAAKKIDYSKTELPSFDAFSEVRAALAEERIPHMLELVEHHEESNMPLLVFSAHRGPIDKLQEREGWATITGDTSLEKRQEIVDQFQNGKLKGVGLTISAGGTGLTLTRASNALFVDLDWTPANNSQAEDRMVRIGQQAKGVQIMRMVSNHALDKHIARLIVRKMDLARKALGDKIGAVGTKPQDAPQAAN